MVICAICGLLALGAADSRPVEDDVDVTGNAAAPRMGNAVIAVKSALSEDGY